MAVSSGDVELLLLTLAAGEAAADMLKSPQRHAAGITSMQQQQCNIILCQRMLGPPCGRFTVTFMTQNPQSLT